MIGIGVGLHYHNLKKKVQTVLTNLSVKNVAIFYGWPSLVSGAAGNLNTATNTFKQFDMVVFGDGIEHSTHGDHNNTQTIINNLKSLGKTKTFGYVPIGTNTSALSIDTIKSYIDEWNGMSVNGIFLDEYGFDYGVTRDKQNTLLDYCHSKNLGVIMNAWTPSDAMGDLNEVGVSNPAHCGTNDYYLAEANIFAGGTAHTKAVWKPKLDACISLRASKGVKIITMDYVSSATGWASDARFKLTSLVNALYGVDGACWTQTNFSSNTLVFAPAIVSYGHNFTDNIVDGGTTLTRHTDTGTLVATQNGSTYNGTFTPK